MTRAVTLPACAPEVVTFPVNELLLSGSVSVPVMSKKDNPVFYVQYAYARINSLLRTIDINITKKIELNQKQLDLDELEEKILRKVFEWPKIIESTSIKFDLHKIPFYLYEISTLFHAYWSRGNENKKYKFLDKGKIKRKEILVIIKLVAVVIENGMKILGVTLPKKM